MIIKPIVCRAKLLNPQPAIEKITATLLYSDEQVNFSSLLFGSSLMDLGESFVYRKHEHLTGYHDSGDWHFYKLSNGGFYLAPKTDEHLNITFFDDDFVDVMTSDATGVVATMFVLDHLFDAFGDMHLFTMNGKLKDFALGHPEYLKIRCATS